MSLAVGIDIGNDKCVVAVLRNGVVDMVLNEESKRETPTIVHFAKNHRLFGSAGKAASSANPKSSISQLKRIIGRCYDEEDIQDELRRLPYDTCRSADGGISVKVQYRGEEQVFTAVQMMAMLMSHLKRMTNKTLGSSITDCVIGVPSYFTNLQRKAYLDAARIAGLKPRRLFHDGAATALGHGIYNRMDDGVKSHVVYVDIGHCDTQVTVVRFNSKGMKVLSHAFDRDLGGRDFDRVIFDYFVKMFEEGHMIEVIRNEKASVRLWSACEKAKKVLSANMDATVSIDCLVGDVDVEGSITRTQFEERSADLFKRILDLCNKGLNDACLQGKDNYVVELVGSGSRIPVISDRLKKFFGRDTSRTLNGSECVAYGCAIQCAMLNPYSRTKAYEVEDILPFSIRFSSKYERNESAFVNTVFPRGCSIPSKIYTIDWHPEPFIVEVGYSEPQELPPGVQEKISNFQITLVDETGRHGLRVLLDIHGIFSLGIFCWEDYKDTKVTKILHPLYLDDLKRNNYDGLIDVCNTCAIKEKPESWALTSNLKIDVKEITVGATIETDIPKAEHGEKQLVKLDKATERAKEKRNALESFLYDVRGRYNKVASKLEEETISKELTNVEGWLYGEGEDESEESYVRKMTKLQEFINPFAKRYSERNERESAIWDEIHELKRQGIFANEHHESLVFSHLDDIKTFNYVNGDNSENDHKRKITDLEQLLRRIRFSHWDEKVNLAKNFVKAKSTELHNLHMIKNDGDAKDLCLSVDDILNFTFEGGVDSERTVATKIERFNSIVERITRNYNEREWTRRQLEKMNRVQYFETFYKERKHMMQPDVEKRFYSILNQIKTWSYIDGDENVLQEKTTNLNKLIATFAMCQQQITAMQRFENTFKELKFIMPPDEQKHFSSILNQIEKWNYMDGDEADLNEKINKLDMFLTTQYQYRERHALGQNSKKKNKEKRIGIPQKKGLLEYSKGIKDVDEQLGNKLNSEINKESGIKILRQPEGNTETRTASSSETVNVNNNDQLTQEQYSSTKSDGNKNPHVKETVNVSNNGQPTEEQQSSTKSDGDMNPHVK